MLGIPQYRHRRCGTLGTIQSESSRWNSYPAMTGGGSQPRETRAGPREAEGVEELRRNRRVGRWIC